jgi:hypothetical protein
LPKYSTPPDVLKRWIAFLRNHADEIAAMDFFTVRMAQRRLTIRQPANPSRLAGDRVDTCICGARRTKGQQPQSALSPQPATQTT